MTDTQPSNLGAAPPAADRADPEAASAGQSEPPRPMRADARRNRDRVLAAARKLFAENGAETQIDDVARVAGVGIGTVYRHFPTKEALMVELVRHKFTRFVEMTEEALESDDQPFE